MALKKLNRFTYFDMEGFLAGKRLLVTGISEWKDYDTQKPLGSKVEVVIAADKTDYGVAEGEVISNIYEKLTVKVPKMGLGFPLNTEVRLVNAEAMVYGEYRNQLSVTAENVEVVGK